MNKIYGIVIVLCLLMSSSGAYASTWSSVKPGAEKTSEPQAIAPIVPQPGVPFSFHDLIEKVSSAVVNISTTKKMKTAPFNPFKNFGPRMGPRMGPEDPFDDFFDKFFEGGPGYEREQHSLGSGFIFKPDGYILTNNHVVANADEIIVRLSDEKEYKAKLIGRDEETDLAIIKIDSDKPLPYEELGDSDTLRIGDWVMAIGNPFGLSQTVTTGIVSAKGRVIGAGPYDNFIQTDASINPGNSGGPLFDMGGNVIGINTAIFASGQGLGFAIPVNMAKKLIPQLIEHGKVMDRGWLGVMIQGITPELAKSFNLPEDQKGALVGDVIPDSPAAQAGLKRGDVIVRFNDKELQKSTQLPGMVATTQPGQSINLGIIRSGKEETLTVVLGKKESGETIVAKDEGTTGGGSADKLGLRVRKFTASEARELGVPPDVGVMVERVEPGSAAEGADVRTGDVIYEINGREIKSDKDYLDAVGKLEKGNVVRLLIRRKMGTIFLAFTL